MSSSPDFIEYKIKVKDEKSSLTEKEISYGPLFLSKENALLASRVDEVAKKFMRYNNPEELPSVSISVIAKMIWQP